MIRREMWRFPSAGFWHSRPDNCKHATISFFHLWTSRSSLSVESSRSVTPTFSILVLLIKSDCVIHRMWINKAFCLLNNHEWEWCLLFCMTHDSHIPLWASHNYAAVISRILPSLHLQFFCCGAILHMALNCWTWEQKVENRMIAGCNIKTARICQGVQSSIPRFYNSIFSF